LKSIIIFLLISTVCHSQSYSPYSFVGDLIRNQQDSIIQEKNIIAETILYYQKNDTEGKPRNKIISKFNKKGQIISTVEQCYYDASIKLFKYNLQEKISAEYEKLLDGNQDLEATMLNATPRIIDSTTYTYNKNSIVKKQFYNNKVYNTKTLNLLNITKTLKQELNGTISLKTIFHSKNLKKEIYVVKKDTITTYKIFDTISNRLDKIKISSKKNNRLYSFDYNDNGLLKEVQLHIKNRVINSSYYYNSEGLLNKIVDNAPYGPIYIYDYK